MIGKKQEGIKSLKDTQGGKKHEDRQAFGKVFFETLTIDTRNALTVIYMLQSPEDDVVLKAIAALDEFGKKGYESLETLFKLGISEYLLPLMYHSDITIKRFATKMLGTISKIEEFRQSLYKKLPNIIKVFLDILEKESDTVMYEFAALTLAELSNDYSAASELLQLYNCVDTLFNRVVSDDPDVQKNCLDIMNHLLEDVHGVEAFINSAEFDIKVLLSFTQSSYPVIQALALNILNQLTSWCRDPRVLNSFKEATGIEIILDILEREDLQDLHEASMDLVMNFVDNADFSDYLFQSGCLSRLINFMERGLKKINFEKILGILARMSQTQRGRIALHSLEVEKRFLAYLEESDELIIQACCLGIANMAQYNPSLDNILSGEPIPTLLVILLTSKNSALQNSTAYALNVLCNQDKRAIEALLEEKREFYKFFSIITFEETNPSVIKNILQTLIGISLNEELRSFAISYELMNALITCTKETENSDSTIITDGLVCLAGFLVDLEARSFFHELNGHQMLLELLKSKWAVVRELTGHLIIVAAQSKEFVKDFIRKRGLQYLLQEKSTRYAMPSWESAIETIFSANLSAKFAYTGRLDFQDITEDGFYVLSRPSTDFIVVDDLLEARISPIFPVYVSNFDVDPPTPIQSIDTSSEHSQSVEYTSLFQLGTKTEHTATVRKAEDQNFQKVSKPSGRVKSFEDVSARTYNTIEVEELTKLESPLSDHFGNHLPDPYLKEYLQNLLKRLAKEECIFGHPAWYCIHPRIMQDRAKIIAEFVAEELSGPEPNPICIDHLRNMHINELKFQLGTNLIPLGHIRVGNYLERAVLFKVLADRIGFPCSLVRGSYGRSWVEVAIPVINVEDSEEKSVTDTEETPRSSSLQAVMSRNKDSGNMVGFDLKAKDTSESSKVGSMKKSLSDNGWDSSEDGFWFPRIKIDCFKGYPNYFLKPNAIVDLMDTPGRLIMMNSYEADKYCGVLLFRGTS